MENIGIVRRVDDLGRIVIPKEMRNMLRIKPGDCLEAFLDNEKIILIKQQIIGRTYNIINPILTSVTKVLNVNILITDTDKVLNIYGKDFNNVQDKKIDNIIYESIINRKKSIQVDKKFFSYNASYIVNPIIKNGDAIGSIILARKNEKITKFDETIMEIIENLLLNNLEV